MPDRTAPPTAETFPPALRDAILAWYASHGRQLAFRETRDPYAVLVSEAMAQQTQASRAADAWIRFMEAFPTAPALAAATPADVLRVWQGLGYNRRALNLWRAARRIVEVHGGQVPADLEALQALPGVGPYTARAVAAIAFGSPVGPVDTNVRRVLGRIVGGGAENLRASHLQRAADEAVSRDHPGTWTHALMDLGATVCRPRGPNCEACPAANWCRFAASPRHVPGSSRKASLGNRDAQPPFATTSRWLRGRIVDRLRAAEAGAWLEVGDAIGGHGETAVSAALEGLAREGLIELDGIAPGGVRRARLALA